MSHVSRCLSASGIIYIGDAIQAKQCLVLVEMNESDVRASITGNEILTCHELYT